MQAEPRAMSLGDVIDHVPGSEAAAVREAMARTRAEHEDHIAEVGDERPDMRDWKWSG